MDRLRSITALFQGKGNGQSRGSNGALAATGRPFWKHCLLWLLVAVILCLAFSIGADAAASVTLDFTPENTGNGMDVLDIVLLFGFLTLLPSFLLLMTCFTRIVIVLSFLRNAMGTQQTPPTQVLVGLALFLTLFIMSPVVTEIQQTAYEPYKNGEINAVEAIEVGVQPLKEFMIKQTTPKSLNLYISISGTEMAVTEEDNTLDQLMNLPLTVVVPSFVTSELERAFLIGFLLYLPFLIIDMVVSSVLMSMGMVMLPPAMISLPFKLLMFILIDGWSLLLGTLTQTFNL